MQRSPQNTISFRGPFGGLIECAALQVPPLRTLACNNVETRQGDIRRRPGLTRAGTSVGVAATAGDSAIITRRMWPVRGTLEAGKSALYEIAEVIVKNGSNYELHLELWRKYATTTDFEYVTELDVPNWTPVLTEINYDFAYSISAVMLNNFLIIRPYPYPAGDHIFYYRHDGTGWVRSNFWIAKPPGLTASQLVGGTLPEGTYDYLITFVDTNTGVESAASRTDLSVADASHHGIRVTRGGATIGATHWRIYRRQDGVDTQYWKMAERPIGDIYWDDTGAVIPNKIATNAHDPLSGYRVPPGRDMAYWKGRLWICSGNDLYYSGYLNWGNFKDTQSRSINPAHGPIYRMLATRDTMYVFGQTGVFVVTGDDDSSFMVTDVSLGTRIVAPYAASVFENVVYFLDEQGLNSLDGTALEYLGADVEQAFRAHARVDVRSIGYDRERNLIVVHGFTADDFSTSEQLVYHPPTKQWWKWSLPHCAGVGVREVAPGDTRLLARLNGSAPAGHFNHMHMLRKDRQADSPDYDGAAAAAVPWYYELGPFDLGTSYAKQLLFMALSWGADLNATGDTLTVTLYADQAASGTAFTAVDNKSPYIAKWAIGRVLHSFKIRIAGSSRRRTRITALDIEADLVGNF